MDVKVEQAALAELEVITGLPGAERNAYITAIENPAVASRVTELLRAYDELDEADDTEMLGFKVSGVEQDLVGEEIGPYRLDEVIGQGGMGVVYRAARIDGAFDRDVAIKFFSNIAPNVLRRRFATERQLLARLAHPNIAHLLDGGSSEIAGHVQPYLVMDYVDGPQFDYDPSRSLPDTIGLFAKVCDAVHYAHTQLILHRDIKPANVKLDADGEPKLLDFGVAKLLEARELSSLTQQLPVALTFNFSAPEVLEGEPASIVSEVYALGVYLYVIAYGHQPYDLSGMALPAMTSTIHDAVAALSQRDGELDAIIAKAMHTDRARRYPSVASLREDLDRYLEGKPISARGDDWLYRTSRFVKRHALAVSLGVATFIGMSATTAVALYQANLATEAEQSTQQTLRFVQSLFSAADPRSGEPLGPDAKLSELLQLAQELARDSFAEDHTAQLNIYLLLARTWLGVEQLDKVDEMLQLSKGIVSQQTIENVGSYEEAVTNLEISLSVSGTRWADAVEICNSLPMVTTSLAENASQLSTQIGCASAYVNAGNADAALQAALLAGQLMDDEQHLELTEHERFDNQFALANVFMGMGKDGEANMLKFMGLAEDSAKRLGESGLTSLALIYIMKSILPNQVGDKEESLHYTGLALETADASPLTVDQVLYAYIQVYHADRLIDVGELDAAEEVFANAKRVLLAKTPETSHYHATTHFTEYKLAFLAEDFDRAENALLQTKAIRTGGGEGYTPWQATTDYGLGKIYIRQGRYEEAVAHIQRAHDFYSEHNGPDHPIVKIYAETLQEAKAHAASTQET